VDDPFFSLPATCDLRPTAQEALAEAHAKGELTYSYRISPEQLLSLARKRSNLLFLAFAFVFTIPPAGLGPFFITFMIRNHRLNEFSATLFMCLIFGTQLFGQIYFGRMGDRLYQARPDGRLQVMIWTILACLPFLLAGFGLPFSVQDLPRLVLFSLLVMVGAALMVGPNPNWMASICDLNLPEHRGTIISLNGLAQTLARIVAAPLCTGLALHLQGSYANAFLVLFSFFLPAAGLLVLVRRHLAPDVAETQHILSERARAQSNGLTISPKTGI